MQKITVVIGLPGSGKSTYIENEESFKNAIIFDDYHKSSVKRSRDLKESVYFTDLVAALREGKDAVLIDIAYCKEDRLKKIVNDIKNLLTELGIHALIEYVYFENNPEFCKKNVLKRNRIDWMERELETIDQLSLWYTIPKDAKVIKVQTSA